MEFDFSSAQFYFRARSGTQNTGAQNQSAGLMEKQIKRLVFLFNYLNRADGFHFQRISDGRSFNEQFQRAA